MLGYFPIVDKQLKLNTMLLLLICLHYLLHMAANEYLNTMSTMSIFTYEIQRGADRNIVRLYIVKNKCK